MLKLFAGPNKVATAVAIALEEAALPYEIIMVDFANAAQTKEPFLTVNPKGRVPALATPDGTITETGALLDYIAAVSDLAMPKDPFAAAKLRELSYYLASTMHVNHAHKMRGSRWADLESSHADMEAKVPETMAGCCAYLEETLTLDPFVGDGVSVVDGYLFTVLNWIPGDGVDLQAYPKLAAYADMMRARPSVQAVMAKGLLT